MRKIIVTVFASLDGVMQAPGGPEEDPTGGFEHGGWLPAFWDDELGAELDRTFSEPFDLLLGRRTYDIFAAHWPFVQLDDSASDYDAFSARVSKAFNRATKYVATRRPGSLGWQGSQALGDDLVARLRDLKQDEGRNLLTQGSSELLGILFELDLVDELRLFTFPIVLGKGKRVFRPGAAPTTLKLTGSKVSPTGVIVAHYARAGSIQVDSFAFKAPTDAEIERRRNLA